MLACARSPGSRWRAVVSEEWLEALICRRTCVVLPHVPLEDCPRGAVVQSKRSFRVLAPCCISAAPQPRQTLTWP